jgi:peptidoglycan/LPS O-acetylase OafA/YrhL
MTKNLRDNSHLLYLDGLRGATAIYVVMHHAMLRYDLQPTSFAQKLLIAFFNHGHYAVNLFIVISGFSLMLPAIRKDYEVNTIDFYKRRIRRILPPYYVALIFSAVMIPLYVGVGPLSTWPDLITVKSFITHILLVNDFFASDVYKINYSLWSIPVECRIYIFFPILLLLWRRVSPWAAVGFSTLLSFVFYLIMINLAKVEPDIYLKSSGVSPYIMLFAMGMLAADVSFSKTKLAERLSRMPWGILLAISLVIFVIYKGKLDSHIGINEYAESIIEDILFGIVCLCLLVICSMEKYRQSGLKYFQKAFAWKPLVFAGTFSYSIYLIHAPILQALYAQVTPRLHLSPFNATIVLIIGGTSLVIFIAYFFFQVFEKPFLNKKRKETMIQTEINAVDNPAI